MAWSIEQVVAIAPSPARFAAADAIATPSRWVALGADERAAWGRCRGSGREPYETVVDHAPPGVAVHVPEPVAPLQARPRPARDVGQGPGARRPCATPGTRGLGRRARPARGRRGRPPARRRRRRAAGGGGRRRAATPAPDDAARPRRPARRAHRPAAGRPRRARPLARRPPPHRPRRPGAGPLRDVGRPRGPARRRPAPAPWPTGSGASPASSAPGPTGTRSCSPSSACCTSSRRPASGCPSCPAASPTPSPRRAGGRCARPTCWPACRTPTAGSSPGAATPARTASRCAARGCAGATSRAWAMVLSFAAYRQALDTSLVVGDAFAADLHRYPGGSWRGARRHPPRR